MSLIPGYTRYDALGLADLVRRGEVTPPELLETAIAAAQRLNPALNAVIHPMYDTARAAAGGALSEGPFRGLPFLLKDLIEACAGAPTTSGSRACRSFVPAADSESVRRYKQAGVVILGKTNTPEFGLVAYTEPALFGPTRNPWNTAHTPGGSSGGSAAAVAAGIVPVASGGDGGGSIRIPASHCGLFGLKPSRGRTPTGPEQGHLWHGAVSLHVLTRSVRDSAAMLDVTQGPEPGAPYVIAPPVRPYAEEVRTGPGRLRIAFDTRSPVNGPVDPECVAAVEKAARLLADLGHHVEEARPEIDFPALARSYVTMYCGEVAYEVGQVKERFGPAAAAEVEPATRALALLGEAVTAAEFSGALHMWDAAGMAMGRFFQRYDLYLTPTVARPPVRIGELQPKPHEQRLMVVLNGLGSGRLWKATGLVDRIATENLAPTPFTQLANLTGLPAMSVPLHWTAANLPVGVQFVAPFGEEGLLFRLAGQLEQAAPWFDRRPPGM
ncbi:MAG: amidase [Symbiobacteriaceae bacterium]|jgi:amidase|nr:amidase [Symbiobacteriaceae bacterium]